jgi:hypothetical protein
MGKGEEKRVVGILWIDKLEEIVERASLRKAKSQYTKRKACTRGEFTRSSLSTMTASGPFGLVHR